MFKHVLILFAVARSLEAAKPCNNLLPLLSIITNGVDVSRLDILPLDYNDNNGILKPIFELTCDEGKTRKSTKGKTYDMPDQILQMISVSDRYSSSQVTTYTSCSEVRDSMGANVGLEANAKKYAFSANLSYKKMQKSIINNSRYFSVASAAGATRVKLNSPGYLTLNNFVKDYIDTKLTGTYETNPNAYNKFIEIYGTHYFSTGIFGGYVRMLFETTKEYFSTKSKVDIEANAKAIFLNVNVDETFKSKSKITTKYYGGDIMYLMTSNDVSKWQGTVEDDPWLFSGNLTPISELILDATKKESMEKAVKNYLIRSYLVDLESLINGARAKSNNSIVNGFSARLEDLKKSKEVSESAVDALSASVEEYVSGPRKI